MFQGIMEEDERRQNGVHYTSEENILKVLNPLFLDDLNAKFEELRHTKASLNKFHKELRSLKFFDPACGCGNFLLISYRELRRLENRIIEEKLKGQTSLFTRSEILIDVDQFYGIEIKAFPCEVARVSLWLMDHLMMLEARKIVAKHLPNISVVLRIPLKSAANIVHGNAIHIPWQSLLKNKEEYFDYIFGNPPYVGFSNQTDEQKQDMAKLFPKVAILDYVACWFLLAAQCLKHSPKTKIAFVATNSITQGEQVAALCNTLKPYQIEINFAYRSFKWINEGKGQAAVYCVIIGFSKKTSPRSKKTKDSEKPKYIYEHDKIITAKNINLYLTDAPDILVKSRRSPLCDVPAMLYGSKPVDGGMLIIKNSEYDDFIAKEAEAKPYIKRLLGAKDFINGKMRCCLWLVDIDPKMLKRMPLVLKRVQAVQDFRQKSRKIATQKFAQFPTLFMENRQPESDYLVVPSTISERRKYIPIAFVSRDVIATNAVFTIADAGLYEFALLTSSVHNAWMRAVAGRLKIDYRYSIDIVYNNFPWPDPNEKEKQRISALAQTILKTRNLFPDSSLAALYDPLSMPPVLLKAHQKLDSAVLKLYGFRADVGEAQIVAELLRRYDSKSKALRKL